MLEKFAPHFLTMACYDFEVNYSKTAAAVFQENVGRQGNQPHGIDIVNITDYFSPSSRVSSYVHAAVKITQNERYLYLFQDEFLYEKICHWDKGLSELVTMALSALVIYDAEYFANTVMEKLISCTHSFDLCIAIVQPQQPMNQFLL